MFKKIKDNSNLNARYQFLTNFGYDCLQKIKAIERNLNTIQWDTERFSLDIVLPKVKAVLQSYQIISHEMYDSCETAELNGLAHSILKMFLQMSSTIKWIMTSFMHCTARTSQVQKSVEKVAEKSNDAQKYRTREISKFLAKEIIQQMKNEQAEVEENEDINSLFGFNKQSVLHSKAKLLSLSSSNASVILQDTVDSLEKRGEYIDKFIALRENYDENFRIEQLLTGQAILDSEAIKRNNSAMEKFKNFYEKLKLYQTQNNNSNTEKVQYGTQLNESLLESKNKSKKLIDRIPTAKIIDELEGQREQNRNLKLEISAYQKKLSSSLKQNQMQEMESTKKKVKVSKYLLNKAQKYSSINLNGSAGSSVKIEESSEMVIDTTEKEQNKPGSRIRYRKQVTMNQRYQKSIKDISSSKDIKSENCQNPPSLQGSHMMIENQISTKMTIYNQVYDLTLQQHISKTDKKLKKSPDFSFNFFEAFNIQLNKQHTPQNPKVYELKQGLIRYDSNRCSRIHDNSEADSVFQKGNYLRKASQQHWCSGFLNQNEIDGALNEIGLWQNLEVGRKSKDMRIKVSNLNALKLQEKNLNLQSMFTDQMTVNNDYDQIGCRVPFDKIYKSRQIKNINFNQITISQFFLQENNAKNYEVLNLSQIFSSQKKSKFQGRKVKASTQISSIPVLTSSAGFKNFKYSHSEFQNYAAKLITRKIFSQLQATKKINKNLYLKLVLFLRYPFSCVNRTDDLQKKMDEVEEKLINIVQVQSHIKRIWSLHSRCPQSNSNGFTSEWCEHKKFIIQFFGFEEIQLDSQQEIQKQNNNAFSSV